MPNNSWQTMRLGDFVTLQRGHDLPDRERRAGSIPIMGSFGVTGSHDTAKAKGPGVTIGRSGGSFGVVNYCNVDYWPLNTALYVKDFHGNDERFAYYLLKSIDFSGFNSGSAQPSLNRNFLHPIQIRVPLREQQKAIARILGSLDDKIKTNRQMNETLEATARAIFRSWFIDFDPVRMKADERHPFRITSETATLFPHAFEELRDGVLPRGWRISTIGRELQTILGGTPSRSKLEYWDGGNIPWINSGKANELRIIEPSEYITEAGLHNSAAKLMPARTTVLAITGATLGQVSLLEIEAAANQSVVGVLGNDELPSEYVYNWIAENIDHLVARQTGGAQQHINKNDVNDLQILIPKKEVMYAFVKIIKPQFDLMRSNSFESKILTSLRDFLLPKLLSGELTVGDTEKLLSRAA